MGKVKKRYFFKVFFLVTLFFKFYPFLYSLIRIRIRNWDPDSDLTKLKDFSERQPIGSKSKFSSRSRLGQPKLVSQSVLWFRILSSWTLRIRIRIRILPPGRLFWIWFRIRLYRLFRIRNLLGSIYWSFPI